MGVPRHLQVPLSIDTSISYDLDTSMFPGLDDPRYKHQPVLMIATQNSHHYGHNRNNGTSSQQIRHCEHDLTQRKSCVKEHCSGYQSDMVEELLDFMDINTEDLLVGLKNREDYLCLVEDVIQGLPQSDELQYLEGPICVPDSPTVTSHKQSSTMCYVNKQQSGLCFSDKQQLSLCFTDKQLAMCSDKRLPPSVSYRSSGCQTLDKTNHVTSENLPSNNVSHFAVSHPTNRTPARQCQSTRLVPDTHRQYQSTRHVVPDTHRQYQSTRHVVPDTHRQYQSTRHVVPDTHKRVYQTSQVQCKRKRECDTWDVVSEKRVCYGGGHLTSSDQGWRNYHRGFTGLTHTPQIRVM